MVAWKQCVNGFLVAGVSVNDVVDVLNDEGVDFDRHLNPATWTTTPEVRLLGEGRGYCSFVFALRFHGSEGSKTVVVKVPTELLTLPSNASAEERRATAQAISHIHANELAFYRLFRTHGYDDLKLLRFFGGRKWSPGCPGFLLLEDVSACIGKHEFTGVFTFEDFQVREAIVEIAKMQAIGFRFPKSETAKLGIGMDMIQTAIKARQPTIEKVDAMKLSFLTPKRMQALRDMNSVDVFFALTEAHKDVGVPAVLTHDDFWALNMLIDDDGHIQGVYDWQYGRFASFAQDLALLLALVLPGETRRARQDEYLQFYLCRLHMELQQKSIKDAGGMERLTLNEVRRVYMKALQWTQFNIMFSFVQFDKANPGKDGGESPLLDRFRCCIEDLWP